MKSMFDMRNQQNQNSNTLNHIALALIIFVLKMSLVSAIFAQHSGQKFERISIKDGLSQSCVQAILQDNTGFLWFGTENGLNKYDGYEFKKYWHNPDDPKSLSNDFIRVIHEDRNGILWIGTDAGLNRFDPGTGKAVRFQAIPNDPNSLSHNRIMAIHEDRSARLWIATEGGGLNCLNPETDMFSHYRHSPQDPNSLSSDEVFSVTEDRQGNLWIGTYGGINILDPGIGKFTHYQNNPNDMRSLGSDRVWTILEDKEGIFWIGTYSSGLDVLDPSSGEFRHYRPDRLDSTSLSNYQIWKIYEDRSGNIWIGTLGGGLNRYDRERGGFIRHVFEPNNPNSISNNEIAAIYEDRSGVLWIGTFGGGVCKLEQESEPFRHYRSKPEDPDGLSSPYVSCFREDRTGHIWIGTYGGGLNRWNRKTDRFTRFQFDQQDSNSLSHNVITALSSYRNDALWVGTYGGGVNRLEIDELNWHHFYAEGPFYSPGIFDLIEQLSANRSPIASILQVPDSVDISKGFEIMKSLDLVVIAVGEGVGEMFDQGWIERDDQTIWNMDLGNTMHAGGAIKNRIQIAVMKLEPGQYKLRYRSDENHSFGRWNERPPDHSDLWGIQLYAVSNQQKNEIEKALVPYEAPNTISSNYVSSIVEDRLGNIWIGTIGGGLNKYDPGNDCFTQFRFDPNDSKSLSHNDVSIVYEDSRGELWIGTVWGGLNRFNPISEDFTRYISDANIVGTLSHPIVLSILEDPSGVLWVGTEGGLNRLDRKSMTFSVYREKDGLPSDNIQGILADEKGRLWISTAMGLSRFDPWKESFKNFDVSDGLQDNLFQTGACYKSREGEMFFGGINGFNTFFPEWFEDNPYVPPVVITGLTVNNVPFGTSREGRFKESIHDLDKVALSYNDKILSFEFAALSFVSPHKNQYQYMMEGFDRDWIDSGNRRFVTYTNLAPGDYVFKVKGSNNDGVWNEEAKSIKINIATPLWETWWFRLSSSFLIIGLGILGYRRHLNNVRMKAELGAAHYAQMSIMPQFDPELDRFDVSGICIPANEVGGDFFDYFWLDESKTRFGIAVGDVSGKAMQSAMAAAMADGMIFLMADGVGSIKDIMTRVNRSVYHKTERKMFTAACLAAFDLQRKELRFTNAGLQEPLLIHNGNVMALKSKGSRTPLGMVLHTAYEERRIALDSSSVLVFFTDGVSEAQNRSREFYSDESLCAMLEKMDIVNLSAKEIRDRIVNDVRRFVGQSPYQDDMTVVVVKMV